MPLIISGRRRVITCLLCLLVRPVHAGSPKSFPEPVLAAIATSTTIRDRGARLCRITETMLDLTSADDFGGCGSSESCWAIGLPAGDILRDESSGTSCESRDGIAWLRHYAGNDLPAYPNHRQLVSKAILRISYAVSPDAVRQAAVCDDGKWRVLSHVDVPYGEPAVFGPSGSCTRDLKYRRLILRGESGVRLLGQAIAQTLASETIFSRSEGTLADARIGACPYGVGVGVSQGTRRGR